ncbi:spermine synthase [Guyanagaster necrorhizus]|uniref:Spermine synthase n=1 Tax=Guyanagaster necrorhizus TaxID=856835 RepID=A0A9P7VTB9_9AGAR|nr:spermine synthase [Guyanagaster necrorhizus MCA 3950]KAG7446187.1 spermine synthase [Guyanagaster necrorhizus MCA 3950]
MAPSLIPLQDGWFHEMSSQWPGQAMSLKVNRILHVEKSLYQDILVFELETFGNVLVLDGVVECTECDEFSYQEMIAHIALNSHPNPEKVLVIGGDDGGVREVLKHDSVTEVVLCDIDEAVIRVSKQYLPHMSSLLSSAKVTVFIGDGFKFLAEHDGRCDVIITDSSDPPLHDALAPGGNISTQGECLWLHLPLISQLRSMTLEIFPVSEYAYTTIPTYPSGQRGFIVCFQPLRKLSDTRYYYNAIHMSALILPEFVGVLLSEGKNIQPKFGREALAVANVNKQSCGLDLE